jgi:pimeloyl-ACP methyl ester carboxylesterase
MEVPFGRGTKCAGFENDFVVFTNEELVGANASLQTPTLILHDTQDPYAPVDHVDWFVSAFPHCEKVSVHAAGHLIWVGPGAEVMHRTRVRFLREHARRGLRVGQAVPDGATESGIA